MRLPKPNNIITEKYVVGMSVFKNRLAKIKLSANESALGPVSYTHLTLPTNREV